MKSPLYDLMGRVTDYKEFDTTSATSWVYRKQTTYNEIGLDTTDTVYANRGIVGGVNQGAWTWVTTYDYDDQVTGGAYTGQYEGGNVVHDHVVTTVTGGPTAPPAADSEFTYVWFDGAEESTEQYQPNATDDWESLLVYDQRQDLVEANIHDGQTRDVFYANNMQGEITQRDTGYEGGGGGHTNISGPHARYYYFGGIEMGDVSNDGTSNVNYAVSITDHKAKPGTGLFQNGGTTETKYADFDTSYDTINGLTYDSTPSSYTVQSGDTLQSIAQQVWGDSNFWYLIADANGLDINSTLVAGQSLIIPNKVADNQNNNSTYQVYDPNTAIGDVSPTTPPKPQSQQGQCGVFGQILEAIVTVLGGDLLGQGFGLATGIQKSFNWNELGMAALSAVVGFGVSELGFFSSLSSTIGDIGVEALQGATASAITQGVGVATGLQKSFNWAGVAAAGVSAGVGEAAGEWAEGTSLNSLAADAFKATAATIANAASRTLISGTDFGDNILKGLPDVIGQTVDGAIADAVAQAGQQKSLLDPNNEDWTSEDTTGATIHDAPVETSELPSMDAILALKRSYGPTLEEAAAAAASAGAPQDNSLQQGDVVPNVDVRSGGYDGTYNTVVMDGDRWNEDMSSFGHLSFTDQTHTAAVWVENTDVMNRVNADLESLNVEVVRAGLYPADVAIGAYNVVTGNGTTGDYLTLAGAVLPFALKAATPLVASMSNAFRWGAAARNVPVIAAESGAPETISLFRKMSTEEADLTLQTGQLQPPIAGTNSSKYLSESLAKVIDFQNAGFANTQQNIVEFTLNKAGYDSLPAVNQVGSAGVDALKINFEGLAGTPYSNIGVPVSQLDQFNQLIIGIRKVP